MYQYSTSFTFVGPQFWHTWEFSSVTPILWVDANFDFVSLANSFDFGVGFFVICRLSLAKLTIFILTRNLKNYKHNIGNWQAEYLCYDVYKLLWVIPNKSTKAAEVWFENRFSSKFCHNFGKITLETKRNALRVFNWRGNLHFCMYFVHFCLNWKLFGECLVSPSYFFEIWDLKHIIKVLLIFPYIILCYTISYCEFKMANMQISKTVIFLVFWKRIYFI